MKTDKHFINTLEDAICTQGSMDRLVSDSAQVEITGRVNDIPWTYTIGNWSSEPQQEHQNPAERKYQYFKSTTNCMVEPSGPPTNT